MQSEYDLGLVGEITAVNAGIIHSLLQDGYIPVISSVALGIDTDVNRTYNVNADIAACEIAKELKAQKLYLLTDVDGVLDNDKKLIQRINRQTADKLIEQEIITGGMIPKINSALEVLSAGVGSVHIINGKLEHSLLLETLTSEGIGTMVTME